MNRYLRYRFPEALRIQRVDTTLMSGADYEALDRLQFLEMLNNLNAESIMRMKYGGAGPRYLYVACDK